MKNNKYIIIGIIILLIASFILGRCTSNNKTEKINTTIVVPEKKGSFESPKVLIPQSNNIKTAIQLKDTIIYVPQVDQELVQRYLAQESELERLKAYTNAISINEYENVFDNEDVKIIIKAKTEGKLLELKPEYTIKAKSIPVTIEVPKPKERVFNLNMGAYTTYSQELKQFDPGIKLDLVGKKGSVLSAGYSIDKNIMVSYSIPILTIKK